MEVRNIPSSLSVLFSGEDNELLDTGLVRKVVRQCLDDVMNRISFLEDRERYKDRKINELRSLLEMNSKASTVSSPGLKPMQGWYHPKNSIEAVGDAVVEAFNNPQNDLEIGNDANNNGQQIF